MHWIRRLFWRLEVVFKPGRSERELREELEDHLRREIRENIKSGLDPVEARRRAFIAFGGVERTKEQIRDARGGRGLVNLRQDLRHAVRGIGRNPGFSSAVILTLALGIGAAAGVGNVAFTALNRARSFPDPSRLVVGRSIVDGGELSLVSLPDYRDYRDGVRGMSSLAFVRGTRFGHAVSGSTTPDWVMGTYCSHNLFQTLGIVPALGRAFQEDEAGPGGPEVAIISHRYWQSRFGGAEDVVGSDLIIDGIANTVVGILPRGFQFLHDVDIWRPERTVSGRTYRSWLMIGRLRQETSLEEAQEQVHAVSAGLSVAHPESNQGRSVRLSSLHEVLFEGYRPRFLLLGFGVALVLLVSTANMAGLLLARGLQRRRELCVRAALGGSRGRLIGQLLTECAVVAAIAGGVGTVLAYGIQRTMLAYLPLDSLGIREIGFSSSLLVLALALSVLATFAVGVFPALSSTQVDVARGLRDGRGVSTTKGTVFLRKGLVVLQLGVAVVLVLGASLLLRSLERLRAVDPGFSPENVMVAEIRLPTSRYHARDLRTPFFSRLAEELERTPGVRSASFVTQVPIRDHGREWEVWNPESPPSSINQAPLAFARGVMPDYFETLGIGIRSGRDFRATDAEEVSPLVIINQAMASGLFPDQDPVGRTLVMNLFGETPVNARIVGVVEDVRIDGLATNPGYQLYQAFSQAPSLKLSLVVRAEGEPEAIAGALRGALAHVDPDIPLAALASMEEIIHGSISGERAVTVALVLFALSSFFLSSIGLFALMAFIVVQRRKEMGIRLSLGATPGQIQAMVLGGGLRLIAMGILIGLLIIAVSRPLLAHFLFQIEPTDPHSVLFVGSSFAIGGLTACLLPSLGARKLDMMTILRED